MTAPTNVSPDSPNTCRPIKLVVCGYTGYQNLGDELLVATLIQHLAHIQDTLARPIHVTVLTATPAETLTWLVPYQGKLSLRTVPRFSIPYLVSSLWQAHGLIVGGGGLFQDTTGLGSPIYYGGLMALAKVLSCAVACWGQGIGPLSTPVGQGITQMALSLCQAIGVRDAASADWVRRYAGKAPHLCSDAVWGLTTPPTETDTHTAKPTTALGLSLRPSHTWPPETQSAFILGLIQQLEATGRFPTDLYVLNAHPELDTKPLEDAAEQFKAHCPTLTLHYVEWWDIPSAIQHCQQVVAMRFHVVMAAALAECATLGMVYDPKVNTLCQNLGIPAIGPTESVCPEHLGQAVPSHTLNQQRRRSQGNLDVLEGFVRHCE